jgi:hypothetical protein
LFSSKWAYTISPSVFEADSIDTGPTPQLFDSTQQSLHEEAVVSQLIRNFSDF